VVKSPDKPDRFAGFCKSFEKSGFVVLGGCRLGENDCPAEFCDFAGLPALLVGNQGGNMWHHFSRSPEYSDGSENPLDRWTVRQLQNLTAGQGCTVFHPSHRPYWPFQKIARKCVGIKPSPLGIMIHPEFGLWHGLRGLLVFEEAHEFTSQIKELAVGAETLIHPCDSCELRPCLSACPVSAFENDTLNVDACFAHLDSDRHPDCMTLGCRARDACPVGVEHRNGPEQIGFHMKAYRGRRM